MPTIVEVTGLQFTIITSPTKSLKNDNLFKQRPKNASVNQVDSTGSNVWGDKPVNDASKESDPDELTFGDRRLKGGGVALSTLQVEVQTTKKAGKSVQNHL